MQVPQRGDLLFVESSRGLVLSTVGLTPPGGGAGPPRPGGQAWGAVGVLVLGFWGVLVILMVIGGLGHRPEEKSPFPHRRGKGGLRKKVYICLGVILQLLVLTFIVAE